MERTTSAGPGEERIATPPPPDALGVLLKAPAALLAAAAVWIDSAWTPIEELLEDFEPPRGDWDVL